MKPLLPYGELFSSGFEDFLRDWRSNLEISIRFLGVALLSFVASFLAGRLPSAGAITIQVIASIIGLVIMIHTTFVLTDVILKRDNGNQAKVDDERGKALLWAFLFIMILRSLAIAGGLIVFVLPGLWMSITFAFAPFFLLEGGKKSIDALSASHELVKGRWWATFLRILSSGFIVGLLAAIFGLILIMVIGLFAGFDKAMALAKTGSSMGFHITMADGIQGILSGIIEVIFIPLGIIYQAKIFHSLKKTR